MRSFIRFRDRGVDRWGEIVEGQISALSDAPWDNPRSESTGRSPDGVELLAPVVPGKIVLVGLNYRAHVAESKSTDKVPDEPVIFMKPTTALIGPGDSIVRPSGVERVDFEAELAVVIGRRIHRPLRDEAAEAIFAATCLNDVTARPLQRKDIQWTRAKGFDSFCPIGPRLVTGLDLQTLRVQSFVNGEPRQDGNTRDQIWPVIDLVHFIAGVMTLHPGDVVSTGTPEGVGPLSAGDRVEIRIEGVGGLVNPVQDAR